MLEVFGLIFGTVRERIQQEEKAQDMKWQWFNEGRAYGRDEGYRQCRNDYLVSAFREAQEVHNLAQQVSEIVRAKGF